MSQTKRTKSLPVLSKMIPCCGWNIWAYPRITDPDYLHRMGLLRMIGRVAESVPQEGTLADIGCGWMPYKEWFSKGSITYIPLDVTGYPDPRFRLIQNGNIPLKSSSVDTLVCWQVLEHVSDCGLFFKELKRIMKPGCQAFFTTHGLFRIHDQQDFWRWTPEGLRKLFEEHGFVGIEIKPCDTMYSITSSLINNAWISNDSKRMYRFIHGWISACINTFAVLAERLFDAIKFTGHRKEATTYLVTVTLPHDETSQNLPESLEPDNKILNANLSVCVAICTRNRAADLKQLLPHLEQLDYPNDSLEFIIVDNASTDNTSAIASDWCSNRPNALLLRESRAGLPFARNLAWQHSKSDLIVYLDDDAHPEREWLQKLTEPFKLQQQLHPEQPLAIGGRVKLKLPDNIQNKLEWLPENMYGWLSKLDYGCDTFFIDKPNMNLMGANFAVPRETLEKIGGFSEVLLGYGGDERWVEKQILNNGGRLLYVGNAVVYHQIGKEKLTPEWFQNRLFIEGRSVIQLRVKQKPINIKSAMKLLIMGLRNSSIGLLNHILYKLNPTPEIFSHSCRLWYGIGMLREFGICLFRRTNLPHKH